MKLKMFKALWGMEHLPLPQQFKIIAEAGYVGIESPMPELHIEELFRKLLTEYNLEYNAMVFTNEGDHKESFRVQVERAATFSPVLINAHSAKDDMPYEQQLDFFRYALEVEQSIGIPIAHETHRGRALFTPWATERLLQDLPGLRLCADFSHWCCVCESLLENQGERLKLATQRTIHIHSRVGNSASAQVGHPAAPENAQALAAHVTWWRDIIRNRRDQGAEFLTIVPELGPPGYMQTLPFTNVPVADLWDTCLWMKEYIESNWEEWLA
jgi:hypothetical protein